MCLPPGAGKWAMISRVPVDNCGQSAEKENESWAKGDEV